MAEVHSQVDVTQRIYDSSCLKDYITCPKKYFYNSVVGLRPKKEPEPLVFGRAFHDALMMWYQNKEVEECITAFDILPKVMNDPKRTKERGISLIKGYTKKWGRDNTMYKTISLEDTFILDMGNGRMYCGRFDRIVRNTMTSSGEVYVQDHKTSKTLGAYFYNSFRPCMQMNGYAYACFTMFGNCGGIILNGISMADNPKERFGRSVSPRTPREIEEFPTVFNQWTQRLEADTLLQEFPKCYSECNRWGKCAFWDLCVHGEDQRSIEMYFTTRKQREEEEKKEEEVND